MKVNGDFGRLCVVPTDSSDCIVQMQCMILSSTISESLGKSVKLASVQGKKLSNDVLEYHSDFWFSSTATNTRRQFFFCVLNPHTFISLVPISVAIEHNTLEASHCFQCPKGGQCIVLHYLPVSHRDNSTGKHESPCRDPERGYSISLRVAELVDECADVLGEHLESVELER